jgi:hypothetical protein
VTPSPEPTQACFEVASGAILAQAEASQTATPAAFAAEEKGGKENPPYGELICTPEKGAGRIVIDTYRLVKTCTAVDETHSYTNSVTVSSGSYSEIWTSTYDLQLEGSTLSPWTESDTHTFPVNGMQQWTWDRDYFVKAAGPRFDKRNDSRASVRPVSGSLTNVFWSRDSYSEVFTVNLEIGGDADKMYQVQFAVEAYQLTPNNWENVFPIGARHTNPNYSWIPIKSATTPTTKANEGDFQVRIPPYLVRVPNLNGSGYVSSDTGVFNFRMPGQKTNDITPVVVGFSNCLIKVRFPSLSVQEE